MKKPYQIEAQRAVKQLEAMAGDGNPAVQMVLPMAEMVGWHSQWFRRGFCLRCPLIDAVGDGVARVPAAPTGLGFLPPRRLAFRLPAGMLAATYARVWAEPPPANRTRSLPGRWHGDASGHHALVRETGSGQNAWVSFGKQGWVNSRERRRYGFLQFFWRLYQQQ